jgi:hypothetical protein
MSVRIGFAGMNVLMRPLSACLAAGIVVWSGAAMAQSQIQFSVPTGHDKTDKSSSLMPESTTKKLKAKDYNAPPASLFGGGYQPPRFMQPLPTGPAYDNSAAMNSRQWRQFLDNKRNWALSTPEDILGVQTPEKILGIKSANDDSQLSAEQRYWNRQNNRGTNGAAGYNMRGQNNNSVLDIYGDQAKLLRPDKGGNPGGGGAAVRTSAFGQTINPGRNAGMFSVTKTSAGQVDRSLSDRPAWGNAFNLPAPLEKPSLDEQSSMDRFRSLLDPSLSAETVAEKTTVKTADLGGGGGGALGGPVDPLMQLPQTKDNPAGRSYQPLAHDAARPVGLKPLPGISTSTGSGNEKKSAPLVQLPPWLRNNNSYK